jgi:hypothetical protein
VVEGMRGLVWEMGFLSEAFWVCVHKSQMGRYGHFRRWALDFGTTVTIFDVLRF